MPSGDSEARPTLFSGLHGPEGTIPVDPAAAVAVSSAGRVVATEEDARQPPVLPATHDLLGLSSQRILPEKSGTPQHTGQRKTSMPLFSTASQISQPGEGQVHQRHRVCRPGR